MSDQIEHTEADIYTKFPIERITHDTYLVRQISDSICLDHTVTTSR